MADFNIDINSVGVGNNKLDTFCGHFNLINLIKSKTCYIRYLLSTIDLLFTNKLMFFQKTHVCQTGVSDYNGLSSRVSVDVNQEQFIINDIKGLPKNKCLSKLSQTSFSFK